MSNEEFEGRVCRSLSEVRNSQFTIVEMLQRISETLNRDREKEAIGLLVEHGPNVTRIAQELGIARQTLWDRYPKFRNAVRSLRQRAKDEKNRSRRNPPDEAER